MTAEVAILSKQCVAMAADSAVTTGDDKIFNTVNKLFAISRTEPVGIMFYNSAFLMGVPIETVIKEYRRTRLGSTPFERLEQYSEDFERFLREDDRLFSGREREASLKALINELGSRINEFTRRNLGAYRGWGHPTKVEAETAVSDAVTQLQTEVSQSSQVAVKQRRRTRSAISAAVDSEITREIEWLRGFFPLNSGINDRIRRLAVDSLLHEVEFGGQTGIVIAGFGTADVFPSLRSFEFHCSGGGCHKVLGRDQSDISHEMIAEIKPFAQADVVWTFLQGYDPYYLDFIEGFSRTFFEEAEKQLIAGASPDPKAAAMIKAIGDKYQADFLSGFQAARSRHSIRPMMHVVASMPKEELAILAEALINLTALKRKASRDQETVGGPTDVAVISKGDGFIWIKRKHYFEPKLNMDFQLRTSKE